MIKNVKNTASWTYLLKTLMVKNLLEGFMKKNSKKQIGNSLEFIKRKGYKPYVKWKSYDNDFSSWIDRTRHNINE